MNKYVERIFKNCKPNFKKLKEYGFSEMDGTFFYSVGILDNQFRLTVKTDGCNIDTEIIDSATDEPYTLFLADGAVGSFIGEVRSAYENVLADIAENCCDKCVFKNEYAQKLIAYVSETYGDELEFLWEKFSDNAVWRRKDNKKWYGAILTVAKNKVGLSSDEKVEIIDLRADADKLVDDVNIFRGYHMNKKHWITVRLDGSVHFDEITKLLDNSYNLAKKT